jgi:NAD(P)-dependent dehydrogenase (short-subunit alcohol dehydrogenase family)
MSGRSVLVTGGAGHLGIAIGRGMLELGADLLLVDRSMERLEAAAEELRDHGPSVTLIDADLESEPARKLLADRVRNGAGRLDVLINNAAFVGDSHLQGWAGSFETQSLDTWRRAMEVNLAAPFHLSQLFLPLLRESGKGSIVNIASIYGILGPDMSLYDGTKMGNPAAYAASKGGLVQLTRWLSTTLAPHVRVNCISPGGIFRNQPEPFVRKYVERTPLNRMGSEEDFIGAAAFLASDLSAWVTGQNIVVDGGWSSW